ncbi:MAG: DUF488 domain-containing protein [Gammaproteobacteria bacterium]|nr:DUF488 domain-containing protein [Gammaproteobacteria bacterium]MDE0513025.1 DUF488 domain-containing protein [Gammaproteobacteria bacterium]
MPNLQKADNEKVLYTVGHSRHPIEHFVKLLKEASVSLVFDVRSIPYSRRNPQFRQKALAERLRNKGIDYVFSGKELGAKSPDPDCYINGKVSYDLIAARPEFADALDRIIDKSSQARPALLCAEEDPLTCHRTILICRHLRQRVASILHIRGDGSIETNEAFEQRLLKSTGLSGNDLFESATSIIGCAYDLQGQRMTKG